MVIEGYDVNEAGQVHAYICYLRNLPFSEQLHWLSFNEEPKAGISKGAFITDFQGEFLEEVHPLQKIVTLTRQWHERGVTWWKLRDEALFSHVSVPHSGSRDEWAESFMDLAKLVVEGFEVKVIRLKLTEKGVEFTPTEQSIVLLEKLHAKAGPEAGGIEFASLRLVQRIRTRVKGHSGSSEAELLSSDALANYETYSGHFTSVCEGLFDELRQIQTIME